MGNEDEHDEEPTEQRPVLFQLFNEIGIINQLSVAMFNACLPDGLHVSHFSVLNHLTRRDDGSSPAKLAQAFQTSKGTMTHTLSVLSKRGFVRIAPHETDGRMKLVYLTPAGREFVSQAIAALAPEMEKLRRLLDLERVQAILPELQMIREVLDDNRDL